MEKKLFKMDEDIRIYEKHEERNDKRMRLPI